MNVPNPIQQRGTQPVATTTTTATSRFQPTRALENQSPATATMATVATAIPTKIIPTLPVTATATAMARTATAATTTTTTHAAAATAITPPSSTAMVYSYSSQGHLHPSSLVEFTRSRTDSTSSLSSLTATISSALNNTHSPPMALEDLSKIQRDLESLRQRRQQVREEQEQEEQEQDDMDDDDSGDGEQGDEQQEKENPPERGQERGHERNRDGVAWHPSSPSQKPRAREKERNQCRLEHDLLQARKVLDGMQADYSVARSITQQYQFWVLSTHSQVATAKQTLVRALEQQQQQQEQKDHQMEDKAHRSEVTCEDECCTSPELSRTMTTSTNTTTTTATATTTTIKTVPCASGQEMQSGPHRHSLTYSSSSSVSTASSPRSSVSSVSMAELSEEENQLFSCLTCYHDSPTTSQHQEHSKRVKVKIEEAETVEDDAQTQQPHSHSHSHARPHSPSLISQKHQQQQQHRHRQQQRQGVDEVGELWIKHLEREHSDLGNQLSLLLQEKAEAEEIKKEWADRLVWTKNRIKGFESALSEMKS